MDSAIIAALISAPVAVVAAAAAYAAGRAQARGAHRGPVDAVRRQHQRDVYAAALAAAHTYLEVLTKALDVSVGDEAGGEAEEGFVDVVTSF
ncbi:hypothetical protein, partial [Streptomyces bobili]